MSRFRKIHLKNFKPGVYKWFLALSSGYPMYVRNSIANAMKKIASKMLIPVFRSYVVMYESTAKTK